MRFATCTLVLIALASACSPAAGQRLSVAGSEEHLWVLLPKRVEVMAGPGGSGHVITLLHRQRSDPLPDLYQLKPFHGELATAGWAATGNALYLLYTDDLVQMVSVNPSSLDGRLRYQVESLISFPKALVPRAWAAGESGPWAVVQVRTQSALDGLESAQRPEALKSGGQRSDLMDMAVNLPPGMGAGRRAGEEAPPPTDTQAAPDGEAEPTDSAAPPAVNLPVDRLLRLHTGRWQTVALPDDWRIAGPVLLVMRQPTDAAPHLLTVQTIRPGRKELWVYRPTDDGWAKRTYPIGGSSAIGAAAVSGQVVIAEPLGEADAVAVKLSVVRPDTLHELGTLRVEAPPTSSWAVVPVGASVGLIVETPAAGQPVDPNAVDPLRLDLVMARLDLLGEQVQEPTALRRRHVSLFGQAADWVVLILVLVLSVVMVMVFWQQDARANRVVLPPGRALADHRLRFFAGLIDLAPAAAAGMYLGQSGPLELFTLHWPGLGGATTWESMEPGLAVIGVFLLHTTVGELLTRRSIGKALVRLEVTDMRGQRASAAQVLIRCVLKLFDLVAIFPLVLILIGPFHQRLGDLVARTVVVMPAQRPPDGEDGEAGEDDKAQQQHKNDEDDD